VTVRVADVESFVDELRTDLDLVDRKIVRLALRFEGHSPARLCYVVATARVAGEVLRLDKFAGELWGKEFPVDEETKRLADQIQDTIRTLCEAIDLDVRHGVIE
jgi:hypothetical protein